MTFDNLQQLYKDTKNHIRKTYNEKDMNYSPKRVQDEMDLCYIQREMQQYFRDFK